MKLHSVIVDQHRLQSSPYILILHGLFGQSRNWNTLATTMNNRLCLPTVCLDLRNHGRSPRAESMTWEEAVGDIQQSVPAPLAYAHVVGHSMGGKVAVELALNHPCRSVTVVDIAPRPYSNVDNLLQLCQIMKAANQQSFREYKQVYEHLNRSIDNESISRFLMTNLKKANDGTLQFDLPLDTFSQFLTSQSERPFPCNTSINTPVDVPCLVVRGEKSDYVSDQDLLLFKKLFNKVTVSTIAGAGHWVHSQQPDQFCDAVCSFISDH